MDRGSQSTVRVCSLYLWPCVSWGWLRTSRPFVARVFVFFYVGEITPPQELSCACFQLARFSSNSLPWFIPAVSRSSRGGPLATFIIVIIVKIKRKISFWFKYINKKSFFPPLQRCAHIIQICNLDLSLVLFLKYYAEKCSISMVTFCIVSMFCFV